MYTSTARKNLKKYREGSPPSPGGSTWRVKRDSERIGGNKTKRVVNITRVRLPVVDPTISKGNEPIDSAGFFYTVYGFARSPIAVRSYVYSDDFLR